MMSVKYPLWLRNVEDQAIAETCEGFRRLFARAVLYDVGSEVS
jgi:hypothetical protein